MSTDRSQIQLPSAPDGAGLPGRVLAWSAPIMIDTYNPERPSRFPAFLENRVYQGSSGRVFPLPFHERISSMKRAQEWQAVHLENDWLRVLILPELGGRIHIAYDKAADYDIFYRNNVIKPALVGLAGPWIAGGVEFNWPQHHRPATFLPTDTSFEREPDGAVTVWFSDHDPFDRMKGMHGIRLRPDSALIEARVRLYNRNEQTRTFLWWANVAAQVDDRYQSFFPSDVRQVADHAKRAVSTFPVADGTYYGVDYPARAIASPGADKLDWPTNIPVPTSYMVVHTEHDFFGGYDHRRDAGFVHWADHQVAPGKKQWTWGNSPFGRAWEQNLTDDDGSYIELMAGVYTDNQPDFSYLNPGETKTFSQFWYPIHHIGPPQHASRRAAARLEITPGAATTSVKVAVAVTEVHLSATIRLSDAAGHELFAAAVSISPDAPYVGTVSIDRYHGRGTLTLRVDDGHGITLLATNAEPSTERDVEPAQAALEPPIPAAVRTVEELFLIGEYLQQYRHATRSPEPYWQEALRRDPGDVRSNVALAARRYHAARYLEAEALLQAAIRRQLTWVPNPADGQAHYLLGLVLARLGRTTAAITALSKAAWNAGWSVPARFALGRLLSRQGKYQAAEEHLRQVLNVDANHLQAADLLAALLQMDGRHKEADLLLAATLKRDPLDQWALVLTNDRYTHDATTLLDVALEFAAAGLTDRALATLDLARAALPDLTLGQVQVGPIIAYHRAKLLRDQGSTRLASDAIAIAGRIDNRTCLPSRLDDIDMLQATTESTPAEPLPWALLASWFYDRGRPADAIAAWNRCLAAGPDAQVGSIAHRNLGIAAYNVMGDLPSASAEYRAALDLTPDDAQLWYESDQLDGRLGVAEHERLHRLEQQLEIVVQRDDLTVVYAELLTHQGRPEDARRVLTSRTFQPWEGGEGRVLAAWDNACAACAARALAEGRFAESALDVEAALAPPPTLGEARHPLANTARLRLILGDARAAAGNHKEAREAWLAASVDVSDFRGMSTHPFSDQTYFSALALLRLGHLAAFDLVKSALTAYVNELAQTTPSIDFFATSLPNMLLFAEDPRIARDRDVAVLIRQLEQLDRKRTSK